MNRTSKGIIKLVLVLVFAIVWTSALGVPTKTELVPMRDGTKLATDIYLPEGDGPFPAIVIRTPYPRGDSSDSEFLKAGYAVVVQSLRGRFGSEGSGNMVFIDDGWGKNQDGYDCIEWVAKQAWCTGKIGTFGVSAPGITQYLAAGSGPPSLACQIVGLAPCDLYNQCVYQGGALRKEQVEGWLSANKFGPESLAEIEKHKTYDDLWRGLDFSTRFEYANAPAVHVAGWYDTFLQGNLDSFVGMQYKGGEGARGKQRLIVGPYTHGGRRHRGELEYPNYDPPGELGVSNVGWFDRWLKGIDNGIEKRPAVVYYTMGAVGEKDAPGNEWRTSDVWPVPSEITPFYLRKPFHSQKGGRLTKEKPCEKNARVTYSFDPDNPVPTVGGNNLLIKAGPWDQREAEQRKDVLVFTSATLEEPLEITGRIKAKLWVSSSAPDTDFTVKLTDVYPDGRSMLVCDGILRARYRNSFEKPELMKPGEIYELEVDLWSTSLIFNKGHKIRVAISSSNYPRFDVNPNTGADTLDKGKKIIARNTIYFDATHPSAIYLPVVKEK